ncbi:MULTISPECIES: DUF4834 family protein [Sphingobacterium]|uniref:DUF4834 domain-containing protein n=2 Tax=Sphingobacterium TaxID=28453 RepID=U2HG09_9SPHI|nr:MULTISPECIES: DUF4834 family protein [Sphingobacterium]ERJ60691.1 hypothetical protein M472_18190 [Sphingobacterium paucimobilis HER1398]MBL1407853.1 DUF4834 family protein [Sphingobacterium faecale]
MGLLYFILFVVAFYYVFKFSMRLLLPFAMRKLTERMMKKAQQQQSQGQYNYGGAGNPFGGGSPFGNAYEQQSYRSDNTKTKEGKVKVDYVPAQEAKRKGTATAGEFIDFEEVK